MGFYFPCNFLEEYMLTLLEAILADEGSRKQKSPVLPESAAPQTMPHCPEAVPQQPGLAGTCQPSPEARLLPLHEGNNH